MKINRIVWGLCLCFSGSFVLAQGHKVGVIEADLVIQNTAKGKAFFKEMEDLQSKRAAELQGLLDALKAKRDDLESKAASMSPEKRETSGLELQRMQKDLKRREEDAKAEVNQRLKTGLDDFQNKIIPIVSEVAQELGVDIVLNFGPGSEIVYVSENIKITQAVIRKFDAKYP